MIKMLFNIYTYMHVNVNVLECYLLRKAYYKLNDFAC